MRWLFLFVLSLNLAYVAWQMLMPVGDSYTRVPPLNNVQPIILLSELKQNEFEQAKKGESEALARHEETAAAEANMQGAEKAGLGERVVAEKPVEEIAQHDMRQGMRNEAQDASGEMPVVAEAAIEVPQEVVKIESCYTLGPFRDLDKLRSFTREIKSYVVTADFRGSEEKEQTLYWVYIQPEKNRSMAIATGKRLKANKIKDFYIIREGEKINGLSLGRFRNKDGAFGLAKKVKKRGFDVIVEPVFKTYTIYWLDYQLADGVEMPQSILDKYIQSAKKDKISRLTRQCDG